jgi:hypothetical protein
MADEDETIARLRRLTAQLDAAQQAAKRATQEIADARVTTSSVKQAVHDASRRPRAGKKR